MRQLNIGTGISTGFELFTRHWARLLPVAAVAALVVGVVRGVVYEIESHIISNSVDEAVKNFFAGKSTGVSDTDLAMAHIVSAIGSTISYAAGFVLVGVICAALVRSFGAADLAGDPMTDLSGRWSQLLPTGLAIGGFFAVVTLVPQLVGLVVSPIGALLGLAGIVLTIWLGVRWVYAPIVAAHEGGGGRAAVDGSAAYVDGQWWLTFGYVVISGIIAAIPAIVVFFVLNAILPGLIGVVVGSVGAMALLLPLVGAMLAAAYGQVSGGGDDETGAIEPGVIASQDLHDGDLPPLHPSV